MSREPQVLRHQTAAYIPCLSVALSSQFHPPYPYSSHGPQIHKLPSLTLSSLGEELFLGLRMYFLSWCSFSLRNSSMFFKTLFCSKTCTWACVCGGQRLAWASSSMTLQLFFLETRSFTELEVYLQGILAAQWASVSPALKLQARATKPAFSVADGNLNSGPHAEETSTCSPVKPSLQPISSPIFLWGLQSDWTGPWHTSGALSEFMYLFKTISWSTYTFWDARRREAPLSG